MFPDNKDEITIADLIGDVICVIAGIVILDICFRNIVSKIYEIALNMFN